MTITKYYCDFCGKEYPEGEDIRIAVSLHFRSSRYSYGRVETAHRNICDDCTEGLGFEPVSEEMERNGNIQDNGLIKKIFNKVFKRKEGDEL